MKQFLRAKHWQIFLIQIGIPIVLYIGIILYLFYELIVNRNTNVLMGIIPYIIFTVLISVVAYYGWMFSIAIGLNNKLPSDTKLNTNLFLFFNIFIITFLALYFLFLWSMFTESFIIASHNIFWFIVIIPFSLFATFCHFYSIYFIVKTIKSIELQREAEIGDYIIDYILVYFLPVGIWFIQPRLNKIIEAE